MPWIIAALALVLVVFLASRLRVALSVFSRSMLEALAKALPDMRRRALEGESGVFHSPKLLVVYSVRKDADRWVHHVSASCHTPALAVGTFFLAVGRTAFHLDSYEPEVFLTQRGVFHLEAALSEEEHRATVERPVDLLTVAALREAGREGGKALVLRVEHRNVPLKLDGALPRRPAA